MLSQTLSWCDGMLRTILLKPLRDPSLPTVTTQIHQAPLAGYLAPELPSPASFTRQPLNNPNFALELGHVEMGLQTDDALYGPLRAFVACKAALEILMRRARVIMLTNPQFQVPATPGIKCGIHFWPWFPQNYRFRGVLKLWLKLSQNGGHPPVNQQKIRGPPILP